MKITLNIDTDMISIEELRMLLAFFAAEIDRHRKILDDYKDGIKE